MTSKAFAHISAFVLQIPSSPTIHLSSAISNHQNHSIWSPANIESPMHQDIINHRALNERISASPPPMEMSNSFSMISAHHPSSSPIHYHAYSSGGYYPNVDYMHNANVAQQNIVRNAFVATANKLTLSFRKPKAYPGTSRATTTGTAGKQVHAK